MDVNILKINFENNKRNRTSLAFLYLMVFIFITSYLMKKDLIDFSIIRSLYMPIVGISMIAIILDYLIFGNVFLIVSLYALISSFVNETLNTNVIIIYGLIFGILIEMYIRLKKKKK